MVSASTTGQKPLMLAMILDKTKGNLSKDEQRLIENTVTELRFKIGRAHV